MNSSNRLDGSLSPYLQQHASNPVHWQPWDDVALAQAQELDVPILLSIGYAACHWCHVMERESFADPEVAAQMNANFVCIKVDREERPDLDKTYQLAHNLLSKRSGGWPLTVFLAPDLVPFFSGTYFPPVTRKNMLSFSEVMSRVRQAWDERREDVISQNQNIAASLRDIDEHQTQAEMPGVDVLRQANEWLERDFDATHGGLGKAPKFPQVPSLLFALHMHSKGEAGFGASLPKTLDAMASGGLHDHVGGGFFRYCVDPVWDIPHFEKMHYDNSLLLELYAQAAVIFNRPAYAYVAKRTAQWMLDKLQVAGGGIVTAWDADSEGEEGKYYVWTDKQLTEAIDAVGKNALAARMNLASPPNFEGAYHLRLPSGNEYLPPDVEAEKALAGLLEKRERRVAPSVDDKVLASSCGMAAHALARAALLLDCFAWADEARSILAFVEDNMFADGQLRTAWREGKLSAVSAFLDDHAYLLQARLSLLETDCRDADVDAAVEQADAILDLFDDGKGGLLFVSKEQEQVLRSIRAWDDGPIPAGNGVVCRCLMQLGWMLGREDYLEAAARLLRGFALPLRQTPQYSLTLAHALEWWLKPPAVVYLTGDRSHVQDWAKRLAKAKGPRNIVLPLGGQASSHADLAKPAPPDGVAVLAYVCREGTCQEAEASFSGLQERLAAFAFDT